MCSRTTCCRPRRISTCASTCATTTSRPPAITSARWTPGATRASRSVGDTRAGRGRGADARRALGDPPHAPAAGRCRPRSRACLEPASDPRAHRGPRGILRLPLRGLGCAGPRSRPPGGVPWRGHTRLRAYHPPSGPVRPAARERACRHHVTGLRGVDGGAVSAPRPRIVERVRGVLGQPRRGWPDLVAITAQWLLQRSHLYPLPAALPFLRLGETIYREPRPLRRPTRVSCPVVAATWTLAAREVDVRQRNAERLLVELRRQPGFETIRTPGHARPGYLRLRCSHHRWSGARPPTSRRGAWGSCPAIHRLSATSNASPRDA